MTSKDLQRSAYYYHLPSECIAQYPVDRRDTSKLMVLQAGNGLCTHRHFTDIVDFIAPEDMLVLNDTKVIPARLLGTKETGGKAEVFLLELPTPSPTEQGVALATGLIKASKRPKPGSSIRFTDSFTCTVVSEAADNSWKLRLAYDPSTELMHQLENCGQVPLPPYITRKTTQYEDDRERYQTVYARRPGAVAAPTAGLHFTADLLSRLKACGTKVGTVTLHVGYGTFAPVRVEDITRHHIHREYVCIPEETAHAIHETKARGGRIWAVGTTTVRTLEFGARKTGVLQPISGWCDLYIYPGFNFSVVDNLITNFHLPDSSLLFLVAAFCGRETLLQCYQTAIEEGYRFFSYGDAMAIITTAS